MTHSLKRIHDLAATVILHFSMDESYRPVRLRKVVLGYPCSEEYSAFRFDIGLNYKLSSIIATYSDRKPTLVVCTTNKHSLELKKYILPCTFFFILVLL